MNVEQLKKSIAICEDFESDHSDPGYFCDAATDAKSGWAATARALMAERERVELLEAKLATAERGFGAVPPPLPSSEPGPLPSADPIVEKDADRTRPEHEQILIERGVEIANRWGEGLGEIDGITPQQARQLEEGPTVSAALAITLRDLFAVTGQLYSEENRPRRCAWCIEADMKDGDSLKEATQNAALYDLEAIRAHTLVCGNHPLAGLVRAARELAAQKIDGVQTVSFDHAHDVIVHVNAITWPK